jgi:hypothetical protein
MLHEYARPIRIGEKSPGRPSPRVLRSRLEGLRRPFGVLLSFDNDGCAINPNAGILKI